MGVDPAGMTTFVLATANADKASEIAAILGDDVQLAPRPRHVPEVEEIGETLLENARLKSRALAVATGLPAISDDTGLEVDALDGRPGVRSARYAGERASYSENVAKLLDELKSAGQPRSARFRTVAVAVWPDGTEVVAEGSVAGLIATEARGSGGFGYDPVFVPSEGDGRTFAEMDAGEKNQLSHRGRAFRLLAQRLNSLHGSPPTSPEMPDEPASSVELAAIHAALIRERDEYRSLQAELLSMRARLSEVEAIELRIASIEGSLFWRATGPLRRLTDHLPSNVRRRARRVGALIRHPLSSRERDGRRLRPEIETHTSTPGVRPAGVDMSTGSGASDNRTGRVSPDDEPLRVFRSPAAGVTVNVVTDSLDAAALWGGARTALLLGTLMAKHLEGNLRVVTRNRLGDAGEVASVLSHCGIAVDLPIETAFVSAHGEAAVPTTGRDHFITTSWSTTAAAAAAVGYDRVVYLLHEDERRSSPKGPAYLRCAQLLEDPRVRVVVDSTALFCHLAEGPDAVRGLSQRATCFDLPAEVAMSVGQEDTGAGSYRKSLFVYVQPGVPDQIYETVLRAVGRPDHIGASHGWKVVLLGRGGRAVGVERPVDHFTGVGNTFGEYRNVVTSAALGIGALHSPHASFPLLDAAAGGAAIVTIPGDAAVVPRADELEQALTDAVEAVGTIKAAPGGTGDAPDAARVGRAWQASLLPVLEGIL